MALTTERVKRVNKLLLAWYKASARPLKIRERSKPYEVLIVEVMAQQTQIGRVDALAARFLEIPNTARTRSRGTRRRP